MGRLNQAADPAALVLEHLGGLAVRYHCPDIPTVDLHLAGLARRIARRGWTAAALRADVDALLDRRLWLAIQST
jgi:hypothetical protein